MSAKPPRGRKREAVGGSALRLSKRPKKDTFEHVANCSDLYNAIKAARDSDGRPISDTLQRAPSRRNEPGYYDVVKKAIDLSRINAKVNAEEYNSFAEMCEDVELLISNTLSFYKPETLEHQHATALQSVYSTEREKILQSAFERPDSRTERLSSTPSTASTSIKKESSPLPVEEWRMEAVICSILEEHDKNGRLLCPPFRVLPKDIPMYYQVIKEPIDLQMIANKIRDGEYSSWSEFGTDLKLIYSNAKQFNESSSSIYKDANSLNTLTKQKLQQIGSASYKKPTSAELNRNKTSVDELLTQAFASDNEEEEGTSEDSNDEESNEDSDLWKLYTKVRQSENAEPFLVLPDKRLYPDYYEDEDISFPVSIFLVNSRIKKGKYTTLVDLVRDLQLMCRNAMIYNIEGSSVYENAVEIDKVIISTAKELDPTLEIQPTVVETEKLEPTQPIKLPRKPRQKKVQEVVEEELEDEDEDDDEEFVEVEIEEEVSQAPSDSINESSLLHKPSIGSDDGTNMSDINSVTSNSPRKKKNRGLPPSRLPGAAETRAQLIPKRSKKNNTGEKLRPGRKSFNELRELYKNKLLEIFKAVVDLKVNGRQVCAEFMFRPDPHRYPDYYNVIENPIDMVTMRHRIENGEYQTSETFMDDFRLLFSNARKYNHQDSQIYADANQLENLVMNTMMKITNNTVLRYPPPSKRTPNFFDVGSPPGMSPVPANAPKNKDRVAGEKPTPSRSTQQQISPIQVKMNEVLDRICEVQSSDGRKLSTLFYKLPSKTEYPDYYNIIRKPMDLSKIRQKLDNNQYETQRNFFADLKLVFENACKFNEPDSQIYKNALTLQQEIIEICAEDTEDEKSPSVQSQVRRILTNLLVAVNNYTEKGRCLSNSFTEVVELFRKNNIPIDDMPFTLDQIKMNMDKGRYKRLDRFQDDVFALFNRVRLLSRPESQLFLDSIDLQKFFISKREELCKGVLVSPASSFTESDLWDEIEARKKAFKREKSPIASDKEVDSEKPMEVDEAEKPKESEEILESVEFIEITYKPKDYVYVSPGEDSAPSDTQKHIFRIETIVRDSDNKEVVLIKGLWVFRPSETYHLSKRKFYEKEVFLTPNQGSVTLDRLRGKCVVLYLDDYFQYKPTEFADEDIYVCEHKYLGRKLHFKRFNTWPYPDEINELAKEPRPEDFNPQKTMTSEFVSRENSLAPVQKTETVEDDGDIDERMRNLPSVLDVHRDEVMMRRSKNTTQEEETNEDSLQENDESKEILYFEQVLLHSAYYRIGDCVLVFNPKKGQCDVMQISRIWQTPDNQGRFFSGMFFARPKEVEHEPSTCFFKREVIAVEQPERVEPLEHIQARCAILTVKQFTVYRPTEIPECDVFVVDHKVSGDTRDNNQYMTYVSHKNYRKMKTYSWSDQVPDDEIYYFKNALNMERKEASPLVAKIDTTLPVDSQDIDNEERNVNDQIENPVMVKDMSWLASQPKLNAKSKSGYILFSAEVRKRIMSENPEAGFGEVSKMVGIEWKKLTDEQKRQYESRASYIAEERAKNDLLTPHSKVLQPGEIRIFVCRWHGCDFQFDSYDGLFDHVRTSHASSDESKVHDEGETHYGCLWMTCVKYRAVNGGKPFPTLPRLLRHIREKHMPSTGRTVMPNQRGKHFFQYIASKEGSSKDHPQGMFVCHPNGIAVPHAMAHRTAIPLDVKQPSLPTSPISTTNHSITSSATPGPSNQQPPATPISHHPPGAAPHQIYHVQHTPHSSSQSAQVVQVINGSSVAYVNAPYQTVIVNQQPMSGQHHQVVSSTGQPTGQIYVQHTVGQQMHGHGGAPHQIVVHGHPGGVQGSQQAIQPGQPYAQHNAPGPIHVYGSSGNGIQSHAPSSAVPYYTPGSHPTPQHYQVPTASIHSTPPSQQMSHAEAARTIVTASTRPEPLFIPPPNSIKVKHVLHSEVYLKYIESLSQTRQKTISNYDKSLQQNQYNTRVDRRKLPTDLLDKNTIGRKREEEIVQALWKLRDNMLESVVGIRRDADAL